MNLLKKIVLHNDLRYYLDYNVQKNTIEISKSARAMKKYHPELYQIIDDYFNNH